MRAFPRGYEQTPGGDGPTSVEQGASSMPTGAAGTGATYRVTPGSRLSPLGSALYLPPIKAMADRTLPPEYQVVPGPG
jgi:hypothetical protein